MTQVANAVNFFNFTNVFRSGRIGRNGEVNIRLLDSVLSTANYESLIVVVECIKNSTLLIRRIA